MMKKYAWFFITATVVACSLSLDADASQFVRPEVQRLYEYVTEHVGKLVTVSNFPESQETWIEFELDSSGEIKSPTITRSCGNTIVDFACLEAVCEVSPLSHSSEAGSWTKQHIGLVLDAKKIKPNDRMIEIRKKCGDDEYLLHLVPRKQVFKPLFGEDILESTDNIVSIGTNRERAFSILRKLDRSWTEFLRKNPHPSKAEVLKQAGWSVANFRLKEARILTL